MIKKLIDILFLLRLPLLAPVWTVMILGWIVGNPTAAVDLQMRGFSRGYGTLFVNLLGFSLLVASIYVVNQIKDIESDRINRKLFLLPRGIISIPTAWTLAVICAIGGFVIASAQGVWTFSLFVIGFAVGVIYNLQPIALKNHPIGGVAANAVGHGVITFLVGWFSAKNGQTITAELLKCAFLSSLAPFFANGAVFLATTIPDAHGDELTGKKTFCVAYGEKATAAAAAFFCALALAASFLMENHFWVMALPALVSLGVFINFAATVDKNAAFYSFKWPVFLLSIFVMLFVPIYGILVAITFIGGRIYYKLRFGIEYPTFRAK